MDDFWTQQRAITDAGYAFKRYVGSWRTLKVTEVACITLENQTYMVEFRGGGDVLARYLWTPITGVTRIWKDPRQALTPCELRNRMEGAFNA
jgi:hypothetical protein